MIDLDTIKQNANKTLEIQKNSIDTWKLGEIIMAIALGKFENDLTIKITNGCVEFNNGCIIKII